MTLSQVEAMLGEPPSRWWREKDPALNLDEWFGQWKSDEIADVTIVFNTDLEIVLGFWQPSAPCQQVFKEISRDDPSWADRLRSWIRC